MSLPKVEHPIYEIYLKSLDRKVKFRPFLVKEEKILLMAKESKDPEAARLAIMQIVQNCLLEKLDVEHLPLFDIEMIFTKLRAKSVGESVRLTFNCQNEVNGEPCNSDTQYTLDLEKVKYVETPGHDSKIMINENMGIKLKYPSLSYVLDLKGDEDEYTIFLASLLSNIEYIFDKESVYKPENTPKEEIVEFIENLTPEALLSIKNFFSTQPKVVLEDKIKCKKCGFEHELHTEGLLDFFI